MEVIICGSRCLSLEPEVVEDAVILSGFKVTKLICGMAKGVDMSAFQWAYDKGIEITQKPYMSQYGKSGGHIRNQVMVDIADAWIAIVDSSILTTGTKDCYNRAYKAKIPMYIHNINGLL